MCIRENVGKRVHAKLHCSDKMLDITTAKRYKNNTLGICPLSEVCFMCTTVPKVTLLPSSDGINTIVIKLTVLGPVDRANVGCRTTEAASFSQHRACQVGPIPQALDNV